MPSILEKLYFGDIHMNSELPAKYPAYAEANEMKEINHEKLLATLNESERDHFEKFLEADGELKGIEHYNTFAYAFRLGALLMMEIFACNGQASGKS